MSIETSLAEAKQDKLFYVVANVILVNVMNQTCLLVKRAETEKEAGSLWAFPGGKGEHVDVTNGRVSNFLGVVAAKECREEVGLNFDSTTAMVISNGAFIRKDGIPVFWATVAAPYQDGEIILEEGAFSEYSWFSAATLPPVDECVGSVRAEAEQALATLC